LLTTHNLERGLAACDRVVVLNRGKVVHRAERAEVDPVTFAGIYQSVTN
jgi:ABC-type sulfate/molybdate transport systems ATPase subunit